MPELPEIRRYAKLINEQLGGYAFNKVESFDIKYNHYADSIGLRARRGYEVEYLDAL
jgi:hypothetical protein